tara:strand:- start:611 stop:1093 length:483 start_codon:yes stop_codon:yes gene_type:complete
MKAKQFLKKLFTRLPKKSFGITYAFLNEIPAKNWFKYFETKDLDNLVYKGKPTEEEKAKAFESLYNEYIQKFGLDESYLNFFKQQKNILKLKIEYALKKEGHIEMHLKLALKKLKETNPTSKASKSYLDVVAMIEDALNRNINDNDISAEKFYTYLNRLK